MKPVLLTEQHGCPWLLSSILVIPWTWLGVEGQPRPSRLRIEARVSQNCQTHPQAIEQPPLKNGLNIAGTDLLAAMSQPQPQQ